MHKVSQSSSLTNMSVSLGQFIDVYAVGGGLQGPSSVRYVNTTALVSFCFPQGMYWMCKSDFVNFALHLYLYFNPHFEEGRGIRVVALPLMSLLFQFRRPSYSVCGQLWQRPSCTVQQHVWAHVHATRKTEWTTGWRYVSSLRTLYMNSVYKIRWWICHLLLLTPSSWLWALKRIKNLYKPGFGCVVVKGAYSATHLFLFTSGDDKQIVRHQHQKLPNHQEE